MRVRVRLRESEGEGLPNGEPSLHEADSMDPPAEAQSSSQVPIPLYLELSLRESDNERGRRWEVVVIQEGWSKNARYYPAAVLREAIPRFERTPVSNYGWDGGKRDHVPAQFRDAVPCLAANIVGWVVNVREAQVDGRMSLVGDFEVADERTQRLLLRASELGGPVPLGLSIDAVGQSEVGVAENRRGHIVTRIDHVHETTIVDKPAAGGKFVRLVASESDDNEMKKKLMHFLLKYGGRAGINASTVTNLTAPELAAGTISVLKEMAPEESLVELAIDFVSAGKTEEALATLAKLADRVTKDEIVPEDVIPVESASSVMAESVKVLEQIKLEKAGATLERMLESSKLTEKAQAVIRGRFEGRLFEAVDLQTEIDNVRALLAEHSPPSGPVQESSPEVSIVVDAGDKWIAEADLFFGYQPSRDTSLTESQQQVYRDLGRVRSVAAWWRRQEHLTESLTTDIPQILGDSMNRSMIQAYADSPRYFDDVIQNVPVSDFKDQSRVLWHNYGGLPIVAEGAQYPDLGFPGDHSRTYSVVKHGGIIKITQEMMLNDDLRALQNIPLKAAQAARHEENLFRGRLVTGTTSNGVNTATSWTGAAQYSTANYNLLTAAFSGPQLFTALTQLQSQREYSIKTTVGTSGVDSSSGTLPVVSSVGIFAGDLLLIEAEGSNTAEEVLVTAVSSTTSLTVTRAQSGTSGSAHAETAVIRKIGRPIPSRSVHLIHPLELAATVHAALHSAQVPASPNNDANWVYSQAQGGYIKSHLVPKNYLANDSNNWYLANDAQDAPAFEMGYLNGHEEPEIVLEDAPTNFNPFNFDVISYKGKFVFGGILLDHRNIQGNLVSGG